MMPKDVSETGHMKKFVYLLLVTALGDKTNWE